MAAEKRRVQFPVRLPKELYYRLHEFAESEGDSKNKVIERLLRKMLRSKRM